MTDSPKNRWLPGIIVAFMVVFAANGALIWAALTHPDPVVESYRAPGR